MSISRSGKRKYDFQEKSYKNISGIILVIWGGPLGQKENFKVKYDSDIVCYKLEHI